MKVTPLAAAAFSLVTASAFGADLEMPLKAQPVIPPFTWTSCYAGVQGGAGWGQTDLNDSFGTIGSPIILAGGTGFTSANAGISGYLIGAQIGCDYQFAPSWVAGIEGAAAGGNIGGNTTVAIPGVPGDSLTFTENTDLLTSVTARVGYAWNDWLLYGKGGAAWTANRYSAFDVAGLLFNFQGLENRFGWTAGAGIEWAFWQNWSIKLEYDYYGFGSRSVTFIDNTISMTSGPVNINQNIQTVKLGVNFHVFAGAAPVVPLSW
jgi:outer membrane immunogenic protein